MTSLPTKSVVVKWESAATCTGTLASVPSKFLAGAGQQKFYEHEPKRRSPLAYEQHLRCNSRPNGKSLYSVCAVNVDS